MDDKTSQEGFIAEMVHPGRCPPCHGTGQLGYASERMREWDIQETCPVCRGRKRILIRWMSTKQHTPV